MKWLGIVVLFLAPFGYIALMRITAEPIEWFVVGFIWALAFALLGETPGWRTLIGAALIVGAALRATSRASLADERVDEPDR